MNSIDRSRRSLAIAAAGLAGFIDAVGFLSAQGYFVSFMSGNTTRLGVDLAVRPVMALIPAGLVLGFVLGVFVGSLLAVQAGSWRKVAVLGLVTVLLIAAALSHRAGAGLAMLGFLVLAMGALNNTFQRDGEVVVGLTYMTGALVRFAQGLAAKITGTGGAGWANWLLLWLGLALGATGGAFALLAWPALALWFASGWALVLVLVAWWLRTTPSGTADRRDR